MVESSLNVSAHFHTFSIRNHCHDPVFDPDALLVLAPELDMQRKS